MPDISKCLNSDCESRNGCYRYTAIANEVRQSYSTFAPEEGEDRCDAFMNDPRNKGKKGEVVWQYKYKT